MSGRTFGEEVGQILACKLPLEGFGRSFPIILEVEQTLGQGIESGEVVGGKHLALDDGKVDLDLVEPTGVNRSVYECEARELVL